MAEEKGLKDIRKQDPAYPLTVTTRETLIVIRLQHFIIIRYSVMGRGIAWGCYNGGVYSHLTTKDQCLSIRPLQERQGLWAYVMMRCMSMPAGFSGRAPDFEKYPNAKP